ncbi:hypothetical protein CLU97_2612 [Chryseobacterium sp. 7]|uniref:hypothetical protein n=1 Tax=Chryseobacterium sp. 7 TaxID=2035214 RepID=UPI000EB2DF1F|nr:hypothetical protein [Chryseobacterium sp. 7]RLJ33136.1 hypothetical protein CLU97_2612 [Chryseobacterium sp. 7]
MITEKVKNIFYFIDFLHSNIENFNRQKSLLNEIADLRRKYNDLDPKIDYNHKFERETIAEKGDKLTDVFRKECKNIINEKINELEITDLNNIGNNHFYNIGEFIILVETQKYNKEDAQLILETKKKYVSIFENLQLSLDNFLPYDLVKDFNETLFDCFKPFLSLDDKLKIEKSKEIQANRNKVTIESLDTKSILNAINKLKSIEFENLSESKKYEHSKRVFSKSTKEDIERIPFGKQIGMKEDYEYSQIPEPKNREEAIERFKKYDAQKRFEYLKEIFSQKYGNNINVKIIEDELKPIYKFIEEANKLSTLDAFENKDKSDYLEYLRLANSYYENINLVYYSYNTYFNYGQKNNSLLIYAKYFLYKSWLEEKREIYTKKNTQTIGYFSTPYDFNIDDDWDTRKKKCEMHNQSIYRRYEKNLKNGDEQLSDLVSKMLVATEEPLQTSEYDLLERQFNQIKSICSIALNSKIDKGCVIEGVDNSLIENKFNELQEFYKKSIIDADIHLKTLEGLKKRDLDINYDSKQTEKLQTKTQILNEILYKYGFFELEKIKQLSEKNQNILVQLISDSKLPYVIAMLDYLDYFTYLERNHFKTKYRLHIEVSKWFNSDKKGRAVRGNINCLLKNSTENKKRYTAFKHKEKVIKDYEELK